MRRGNRIDDTGKLSCRARLPETGMDTSNHGLDIAVAK